MKLILYYLGLLVFVAIIAGFMISQGSSSAMSVQQMLGVSAALVLYIVGMALIGEGHSQDDRELLHKNMANRAGLIAAIVIFSLGIIYQMFVSHRIDYWLLIGLIVITLTKIISLIFLNYRR